MIRDAATERQVQAADPAASTWLSANAGSGKTRVLIDRVARLLLAGVAPQRILCLTYTKAAATEMQNRLFRRLGSWSMLDEGALKEALSALGVGRTLDGETLANARRLFARAIETPGGLRILTIHSFCASLLRRFPLEAGVSPLFTELDARAAKLMRNAIVDDLADTGAPEAVAGVARLFTDESLDDLVDQIAGAAQSFTAPLTQEEARLLFGLPPDTTLQKILTSVFADAEADWMPQVIEALRKGSVTDIANTEGLAGLDFTAPGPADLVALEDILLTKSGKTPFTAKIGSLPTKATRAALGGLLARLEALMARVEAARPQRIALQAAERAHALHRFAAAFLPEYAARKAALGALDFDDLITKARDLLTHPEVAQWVLFRLDGGIDHILVDEAQDTSPAQWRVIELLAQEFTSGMGARETERTIFVVGDKKQSIYSFQGADLDTFDAMKGRFRSRLSEVQTHLLDLTLEHSFRSSPAILRLVDLTFDDSAGRDLGGEVKHIAFKSDLAGRVDLWPVISPQQGPETDNWYDPTDLISEEHHAARLARRIAAEIAEMIARGEQIPTDAGPRPVSAGDFLILVQRRSALFSEIIRACKAAGLPIAGSDRLKLGGELAVKDLAALLAFLATPEDDLSLASVLRSPLFGWTEAQLFTLAQGRASYLWAALRDQDEVHAETLNILHDLRDQADYLRPYDLLARALIRHDGRRRLLARLGEEAEDGIDALLSQALAYERSEVPSLTGFLGWLEADAVEVKRQMDTAGDRIRVMTVHGAKGLEAPIVILPETQDRKPPAGNEIVTLADGTAAWRTPSGETPGALAAALTLRSEKAAAESLRLLYVAMTRAQCWLIVAAAGKTEGDTCWYNLIRAGMDKAGASPVAVGILRLAHGTWPSCAPGRLPVGARSRVIPDWAEAAAPAAARPALLLSPSDLGGAKVMPGEADPALEAESKRIGTEMHLLLEHLPRHPPGAWAALAESLIPGDPARAAARLAEARRVLADPGLGTIFAPGALTEVTLTGEIAGRRVLGTVDRLLIRPGSVLATDYKSNRLVPRTPDEVPEGILRQMGAYAGLLAQIYPGIRIETAVLWTRTPSLMLMPPTLIMAALQRATFP